jgi:hypothetical protein
MQEDTIEQQVRTPCRSPYSIGLGKFLCSIRASTNGDTIGGPLAAYALLGNDIFDPQNGPPSTHAGNSLFRKRKHLRNHHSIRRSKSNNT